VSYRSVIHIESKSKNLSILCALFLCILFLSLVFASFTFGFVHQLQTAKNEIFFGYGKIFDSGLDGKIILYTIFACYFTCI
jgi:hypothetical protein